MDTLSWHTLLFGLPILFAVVLGAGALTGLFELGEVDLEVDADGELETEGGPAGVLALLGLGRAPLSVLLATGLLTFGAAGLGLRALVSPWIALVVAAVVAPLVTGLAGRVLGHHLPTAETYAAEQEDLIGRTGVARLNVDGAFGVAQVRDAHGSLHAIRCRADAPLSAGAPVVVVAYDEEARRFEVAPLDHDWV